MFTTALSLARNPSCSSATMIAATAQRVSSHTRSASTYIFNWGVGTEFELGHEKFDTEDSYMSKGNYYQKLPRRLVNSGRIQKVCFGNKFGLGLTNGSQLLVWGKEYPGRSALNTKDDLRTPTLVDTSFAVADIACGQSHCAAIDSDGQAYLWGDNGNRMGGGGQLGNQSYDAASSPMLVNDLAEAGVKVRAISCGESHTLFLTEEGSVYSCGMAEYGRLGIMENGSADVLSPQLLEKDAFLGEEIIQVSAGFNHSMALSKSGQVFSWGRNDQGQLGMGDTFIDMHSMEAAPVVVDSEDFEGKRIVKIKAGRGLSGALTDQGELYHWGHKILHQPVLVMHDYPEDKIVDFTISGNGSNMCTTFITESGELYSVGPNGSSILGRSVTSGGSFLSSLFGGASNNDGGKTNQVDSLNNRVVHKVFGGFGEQMAAMASAPIQKDAE